MGEAARRAQLSRIDSVEAPQAAAMRRRSTQPSPVEWPQPPRDIGDGHIDRSCRRLSSRSWSPNLRRGGAPPRARGRRARHEARSRESKPKASGPRDGLDPVIKAGFCRAFRSNTAVREQGSSAPFRLDPRAAPPSPFHRCVTHVPRSGSCESRQAAAGSKAKTCDAGSRYFLQIVGERSPKRVFHRQEGESIGLGQANL